MGKMLRHSFGPKKTIDRVEMVSGLRNRDKVEFGITIPRIAAHCQIYSNSKLCFFFNPWSHNGPDSPTQGDIRIQAAGRGYLLSRRYKSNDIANPPPALSPQTTRFSGGICKSS